MVPEGDRGLMKISEEKEGEKERERERHRVGGQNSSK